MEADWSVEMGHDDAALEFPWASGDPAIRYYDLKKHPELLSALPEPAKHPALREFLAAINSAESPFQTAKCDVWREEVEGSEAECFASYVDVLFADHGRQLSFVDHESLVKTVCKKLAKANSPESVAELIVRRCYYHFDGCSADESVAGCCVTCYVRAFGDGPEPAYANWEVALGAIGRALLDASLPRGFR